MISKQMQEYIELALGDKVLEEKEIEFLKKKAAEFGDDPMEVEMMAKNIATKRKAQEDMKKCPNCGASIVSLSSRCPYCKIELALPDQTASTILEEFKKTVSELEAKKITALSNQASNLGSLKKTWIIFKILVIVFCLAMVFGALLLFIDREAVTGNAVFAIVNLVIAVLFIYSFLKAPKKTAEEKMLEQTVLSFTIPNSRQDLLEICMYIASRIQPLNKWKSLFTKEGQLQKRQNAMWISKLEQIENKAQLLFKSEPEFLGHIRQITREKTSNIA